jgi:hypothetical protein
MGILRQMTAMVEPTTAIHTTDTAAGTRTMKSWKCSEASRKPNADDFIDVSMAVVRDVFSSNPANLRYGVGVGGEALEKMSGKWQV